MCLRSHVFRTKKMTSNEESSVFIRNLSFDTDQESLKNFMKQFGWVDYCLICVDKTTGHSKGSAFVRFKKKESADKCLSNDEGSLYLDGRRLFIDRVIPKNNLEKQLKEKKEKKRDLRNLYLAREGFIHAGSQAAEGVSEIDLKKRLALEVKKRKLLQILTNYVSETRLCIHNLPESIDDKKLKKLFLAAADDASAKIIEARVMKNRQASGKLGKSKGFGFVEFTQHQHALTALRRLNNNPDIFTSQKRPIVEFAIEDKVALNKRKKRMEKALAKRQAKEKEEGEKAKKKEKKKKRKEDKIKLNGETEKLEKSVEENDFAGIKSEPVKAKEKIQVPKVNRKITESLKAVEEKARKDKFTKKLEKIRSEQLERRKEKIARRREMKAIKKAKNESLPDLDDFEAEFLKKSIN